MQTDRYYRHSGRFPPLAAAAALVAGLLACVPLAFAYSYIIVYIPVIGTITVFLTIGYGALAGFVAGLAMQRAKVRSRVVSLATAIPVGIFALWASWVTWVYAILRRSDADVGLLDLVLDPAALWRVILIINEKGAWNLKGMAPTGGVLWALWGIEAAIILGLGVTVGLGMVREPFCEACNRWCAEVKGIAVLGSTSKDEIVPRLEQGDYAVLREPPPPTEAAYTRIDLHQCPSCKGTTTLTATGVTVVPKKGGKPEVKERVLLEFLLLPEADLSTLQTVLAERAAREAPLAG